MLDKYSLVCYNISVIVDTYHGYQRMRNHHLGNAFYKIAKLFAILP